MPSFLRLFFESPLKFSEIQLFGTRVHGCYCIVLGLLTFTAWQPLKSHTYQSPVTKWLNMTTKLWFVSILFAVVFISSVIAYIIFFFRKLNVFLSVVR